MVRRLLVLVIAASAAFAADDFQQRIDSGRDYWAFRSIVKPEPPQSASAWVKTPVDTFILAELEKEGLSPSSAVEKERLLRRVFLDLTGLPPTPEQTDRFLNDTSPRAYEDLVERLLGPVEVESHLVYAKPMLLDSPVPIGAVVIAASEKLAPATSGKTCPASSMIRRSMKL